MLVYSVYIFIWGIFTKHLAMLLLLFNLFNLSYKIRHILTLVQRLAILTAISILKKPRVYIEDRIYSGTLKYDVTVEEAC